MMAKQASKSSTSKEVRVIHIGNPRMVKVSPSEFSAVVQSLTGQKKRQQSPSGSKQVEKQSSKSKVPRHEGEFQLCSILGIPETAVLPQMAEESNSKYGNVDQQEICEMFTNHMTSPLDCFEGNFFRDIFSFDFMSSMSDVV